MSRFSKPGSDGTPASDFREWRSGVTFTVRPEILAPLQPGREYRINANVRLKIGSVHRERQLS
jgi:hypothetical protein